MVSREKLWFTLHQHFMLIYELVYTLFAHLLRTSGLHFKFMHYMPSGHVDAGKSTLMGHVLYQIGTVNKKTMHKYEQESKKLGKSSFAFAWVLDETEEER